jgi:hypothetical protein
MRRIVNKARVTNLALGSKKNEIFSIERFLQYTSKLPSFHSIINELFIDAVDGKGIDFLRIILSDHSYSHMISVKLIHSFIGTYRPYQGVPFEDNIMVLFTFFFDRRISPFYQRKGDGSMELKDVIPLITNKKTRKYCKKIIEYRLGYPDKDFLRLTSLYKLF